MGAPEGSSIVDWTAMIHAGGGNWVAFRPLGAALLVLSLVLMACEYPGVPHSLAAQIEAPVSAGSSPALTPSSNKQDPAPGSKEPELLKGRVNISLKDFLLDPDRATVKAGAITFVLKNEGRYTHDFRVEGQGIDEKAPKVGQGRTFEWQITLPPGTYRVSCPISNHADRGMVGTLEVVQ